MNDIEFIDYYSQNAKQLMWFLGAGTSRTAGMPTATDIIWHLKRRYYCVQENQEIQRHDINKPVVKQRIQSYMDSLGFPALWSHGDFKYRSIKNLSQDLKDNDSEIQKCFLAGTDRYGLVVTGYSGRDDNVMSMFHSALDQNNAFPQGLFWTVPKLSSTESPVIELIEKAKAQGVNAHVVETGTFDIMLSRIWKQVENKSETVNRRVKKVGIQPVSIPTGNSAKNYPLLRTNALPILAVPSHCGCVSVSSIDTYSAQGDTAFSPLCNVLGFKGKLGYITDSVRGLEQTFWAEAVSVKLDFRDGKPWLLLQPDVWISPMKNREEARDHLSQRKLRRYNNKSYQLLDAWIGILFGQVGGLNSVETTYRPRSDAPLHSPLL